MTHFDAKLTNKGNFLLVIMLILATMTKIENGNNDNNGHDAIFGKNDKNSLRANFCHYEKIA